ncbi:MAG: hypothetical protein Q8869_01815, partial [Candidatus Phytoplasma australasiaticum]|nr:hypothetical protein [Candidatus Phytoplasma australasiaticum]
HDLVIGLPKIRFSKEKPCKACQNTDLINTTKAAKIINLIQKSTLLYDFSVNITKNKFSLT